MILSYMFVVVQAMHVWAKRSVTYLVNYEYFRYCGRLSFIIVILLFDLNKLSHVLSACA